ncbi:MAG: hypothetical protein Q9M40_09260 [Sulfurimonas sp.]|nr:hypothetical protein [Sulfurimonas sp.]
MNDSNATQASIAKLLKEQNSLYEKTVNSIMSNKNKFIQNIELYEDEIFSAQESNDD